MNAAVTITCGYSKDWNGDDTGIDAVDAEVTLNRACVLAGFTGWTITPGTGAWTNDESVLVTEPVLVVSSYVYRVDSDAIARQCAFLARSLKQACVALCVAREVSVSFVSGPGVVTSL